MKKYLILFLLIGIAACKSRQPIVQVPVKTVERKVTTLVPFYIQPDSAILTALFECDSTNNVILKNLTELKSKNMQSDFDFKDGKLDYKAKTARDTVFLPSDTTYLEKDVPVMVPVEKVVNKMTPFQSLFYNIGLFGSILLAVYLTIKYKLI